MARNRAFGVTALAMLAACGGGTQSGWGGVERDSAGIVIVENPAAPSWSGDAGWRVEEELRIGTLDGDPAYQFGNLTAVAIDEAGRVYVLDQLAREIRAFDASGGHLFTAGRPGTGPGELSQGVGQTPGNLLIPGNGMILVPDMMLQRVTRYTDSGEPAGSFPQRLDQGLPVKWMVTPGGELIQQVQSMATQEREPTLEYNRLIQRDLEGAELRRVADLPLSEAFRFSGGAPQFRIFAPNPMWTVLSDGRIVTGMDSEVRLEIRSEDGEVERIFTLPHQIRELTTRDHETYRAAVVATMVQQGAPRPVVEQMARMIDFDETLPAFGNIVGGPDGTIWLQRVQGPDEVREAGAFDLNDVGAPDWDVFDARGRYLGPLRLPRRFTLHQVRDESLVGVWRDELDVQHVLRLRLVR